VKQATIHDLRYNFAKLSKRLKRGETIEITKRGKPIADLIPKGKGNRVSLLGCTPSPYPLPADINEPVFRSLEFD
jgi:prevent-host-death family protein